MASFDWTTCTIDMSNLRGGAANANRATMAALPADEPATVSCVHEYIHFLQAMGSHASAAMMAEFVEIGTIAALILQCVIHGQSAVVQGYHPVLADLRTRQPCCAWEHHTAAIR